MTISLGLLVLATLRFMRSAPGSTVSVFVGVVIGIISIAGVHILSERIGEALSGARPAWLDGVTHVATRDGLTMDDYVSERLRWRNGELRDVTSLMPLHEFVTADGVRVVGTDWIAVLDGGGIPPTSEFRGDLLSGSLRGAPAIVTGLPYAAGEVFALGSVPLQVMARRSEAKEASTPVVFVDLSTAFRISGRSPKHLDAILISQESSFVSLSVWLERIMPGISAGLPAADLPQLPRLDVRPVATELPTEALIRAVLFNLGALGSLSLLVALLLMYQTATVWLRRQQLVLRSLFEVSVSMRLLAAGFIGALFLLAIPATFLGIVCGERLAAVLQSVVLGAPLTDIVFPGGEVLLKSLIAGTGVAIVGGSIAWWREWPKDHRGTKGVAVGVAGLLIASLAGWIFKSSGLAGIFFCILVVALVAAFCAMPLLRKLRHVAQSLRGPLWMRLGIREASWFPEDLGVACAALALAVAVSIGVGLMVESFRSEFSELLETRLAPDVLVTVPSHIDARQLATDVAGWSGVEDVSLSGEISIRVRGLPVVLGFTTFDRKRAGRYGYQNALNTGEVLINESLATVLDIGAGEELRVGEINYNIAHVFKGYGESGLRLLIDASAAHQLVGRDPRYTRLSVDTLDPEAMLQLLERIDGVEVSLSAAVRARALAIFDRTFATSDALTWLALLIASGALLNALAGFRLSQQATGRLLDAVGAGGLFNLGASLVRALVVGGAAIMIAIPLGIWLGFILCSEVNPRAFGWTLRFQLLFSPVMVPVILAILAALVAGAAGGLTRVPGVRQ